MTIYANGRKLDIYDQDIVMTHTSMRFSNSIPDTYSTDIELPKTENNLKALGIYSDIDQDVTDRIQCTVTVEGMPNDGYLIVSKISDSIFATVYYGVLPSTLYDRKLSSFGVDSSSTIFNWDEEVSFGSGSDVDMMLYYPGTTSTRDAQCHPSMAVSSLLSAITAETGVTMPTVSDNMRIICPKAMVCPQNNNQRVYSSESDSNNNLKLSLGGQSVVNDFTPYQDTTVITFNRSCTIVINAYARLLAAGGVLAVTRTRGLSSTAYTILTGASNTDVNGSATISVIAGDKISFQGNAMYTIINMHYIGYEITSDDYDTQMVYIHTFPKIPAVGSRQEWRPFTKSYNMIGTWCNLPDVTVKELLTALCWMFNQKLQFSNNEIRLVNATDMSVINAVIKSVNNAPSCLGKKIIVKYRDGSVALSHDINSNVIADSVTIHESSMGKVGRFAIYDPPMANIDQYSYEGYEAKLNDVKNHLFLTLTASWNGIRYLKPNNGLTMMGVDSVTRCKMITAETYDHVGDADHVSIDGRKYMVVSRETDENGLTTIEALLT